MTLYLDLCFSGSQSDEGLLFQAANQQDQPQFPRETSGEGLSQQLQGGGTHKHTHMHTPTSLLLHL